VRICTKNTGPFDSNFINIASIGNNQLKIKMIMNNEKIKSNNLLKNPLSIIHQAYCLMNITLAFYKRLFGGGWKCLKSWNG
jgi:hypothetical protein